MNTHTSTQAIAPLFNRFRHELKQRSVSVAEAIDLTPNMRRIVLTGEDLSDFSSLGFDDHVKVILIDPAGNREMRDYTPRRFDREMLSLTIDFAMHEAGPITGWARCAQPGDVITIGGPRGSSVVLPDVTRFLLIGDETALPAMGRKLEEARDTDAITVVAAVSGSADEQKFETKALAKIQYLHRPLTEAWHPGPWLDHIRSLSIEPETFVWVAAEAKVAKAIRHVLTEERRVPLHWVKASGYWVHGEANANEKF